MNIQRSKQIKEFGDFQTPTILATTILTKLKSDGLFPASILEPTCGTGSFIVAAMEIFTSTKIFGFDINSKYIQGLKNKISQLDKYNRVFLNTCNFFDVNWREYLKEIPSPYLIVGNLPWITSSELSRIKGNNIPKRNIFNISDINLSFCSDSHDHIGINSITKKRIFSVK